MIEIIPAIDIIDGKCVRLTQGDYAKMKVYDSEPLDVAKRFEGVGIRRLHLVDLDGAKQKKIVNHKVLERIASKTSLVVDFGGGIQSNNDVRIAFECGADLITGGSIAVKDRELFLEWVRSYGAEKIILGADAKDRKIATHGWTHVSELDVVEFVEGYFEAGLRLCVCTDISKDGLLEGTSVELYKEMRDRLPELKLIASGGVSSIKDVEGLVEIGVYGVIIGKAIYEGRIALKDLKGFV